MIPEIKPYLSEFAFKVQVDIVSIPTDSLKSSGGGTLDAALAVIL